MDVWEISSSSRSGLDRGFLMDVGPTAASADTCAAAILAVFHLRASPSTTEWFDLAGQPFHGG
jgi:hypothetical protein